MNHLLFWISYFGRVKGNLCQVSAAQAVHSHYCTLETYWTYILISEPLLLQIEDNLHHMSCAAFWRTDKRQSEKGQKPLNGWRCSLILNKDNLKMALFFFSHHLFFSSRWKATMLFSEWDCPRCCQMSLCCAENVMQIVDTKEGSCTGRCQEDGYVLVQLGHQQLDFPPTGRRENAKIWNDVSELFCTDVENYLF